MNRLFALLLEYGSTFLFIILQLFSFYLIVTYNNSHREIYLHSANQLSGSVLQKSDQFRGFLNLEKRNDSLLLENARLKEEIIALRGYGEEVLAPSFIKYEVNPAKIINQSIHYRNNFITINKGKKDGLKPNLGVISDNGIAGIVKDVGEDYSRIISLLNTDIRITGAVKSKNYFGNLSWDGVNRSQMILEAIPGHANIAIGDTIVTNGYSLLFPQNIDIGEIKDFYVPKGSANFIINVTLFTDFSNLQHVYVLKNNNLSNTVTIDSDQ